MKILGGFDGRAFVPAAFAISAHCNRVHVRDGHLECVSVELGGRPLRRGHRGLALVPSGHRRSGPAQRAQAVHRLPRRAQPAAAAGRSRRRQRMAVSVGRLRPCRSSSINFVLLSHNTVRAPLARPSSTPNCWRPRVYSTDAFMAFRFAKAFAPATVANVGPGFDVFGFALEGPGDSVELTRTSTGRVRLVEVRGDGGKTAAPRRRECRFRRSSQSPAGRRRQLRRRRRADQGLPLGSGLGSSSLRPWRPPWPPTRCWAGRSPSRKVLEFAARASRGLRVGSCR